MKSIKVALIFGGTSNERMVSVASAQNVVNYFRDPEIYFISPMGAWHRVSKSELLDHKNPFVSEFKPTSALISKDLNGMAEHLKLNVCFLALHGTAGEDGVFQDFFESHKIAYTGSSAHTSRLCFDKSKAKEIARKEKMALALELRVHFDSDDSIAKIKSFFNDRKKIVLKPNANGSSFGLFIVSSNLELDKAIEEIKKSSEHDYIVEEFIVGREMTVGVLEKANTLIPLAASEVILDQGISFDYQGKYLGRGTKEITPAMLSAVEKKQCQDLALQAHAIFGCSGYSRTDMMLTSRGPVFMETNTLPGLTKASFYPQQLEAEKIPFSVFIEQLLLIGQSRYQKV